MTNTSAHLVVDLDRFSLSCGDRCVTPRRRAMAVIALLSARPAMVFEHDLILAHLPGDAPKPKAVTDAVLCARRTLRQIRPDHDYIQTHHGLGYQWRPE